MNITERSTCRICDGVLTEILDLGEIYPSNFVNGKEKLQKASLVLTECSKCGLVQLKHTVELDSMYRQYWYRSGLNPSMVRDLEDVVASIEERVGLIKKNEVVVDIGCNDGTMLGMYMSPNIVRVGVDPARNLETKNTDYFINEYFSAEEYNKLNLPKAKVITSIAMFYDLEDPHAFVKDIKEVLHEDGIWVVQFTDLLSMIKINAFDNICHEHLEYYSLRDLVRLFNEHELTIFDVSYNKVNGGSLRVYVSHRGKRAFTENFFTAVKAEDDFFRNYDMKLFGTTVQIIKQTVQAIIRELNLDGIKVALLSASTKGNTMLQYFGLDYNSIDHAAEINKDKFGLKTVGTNIPIISQEESMKNTSYYLVPAWHFIDDFVVRNSEWLENGGTFIVPMPLPAIITKDTEGNTWKEIRLLRKASGSLLTP